MNESNIRNVIHFLLGIVLLAFTLSHGHLHKQLGEVREVLAIAAAEIDTEVTPEASE